MMQKKIKLKDYFNHAIIDAYDLNGESECIVSEIAAIKLLSHKRLDIIAKMLYLKYRNLCVALADDIYRESISVVTNGTFVEFENENKKNYVSFKNIFEKLYIKISEIGYDFNAIIPVDEDGTIMDGAHRVAIAATLGLNIPIVHIPVHSNIKYDADFFVKKNCDTDILNIILQGMIEYLPNIYIANVWPNAKEHDEEIEKVFKINNVDVLYKVPIFLNENASYTYTYQIYFDEEWSGNINNGFAGTNRKSVPCFGDCKNALRVYILQASTLKKIVVSKEEVRQVFKIDNHSIHITDTKEEAIRMGNILLNKNSIFFMNYGQPLKYKKYCSEVYDFFSKYKNVVLTGSGVMALFGICEANDIDYLCSPKDEHLIADSHNHYIGLYGILLEQALYDPRMSFYFLNMKILTLDIIAAFKKKRNERKDTSDLTLIRIFYNNIEKDVKGMKEIRQFAVCFYRKLITKFQIAVIKFSHRTGTYLFLRKVYHKIIDKK